MTTALSRARKRIEELGRADDFDPAAIQTFLRVLRIIDEEQEAEQERPLDAERLARALDDHLPRMAFVQYGQFYNDDPGFDIEAYYERVAEAMLADLVLAKPLIHDEPVEETSA